MRVKQEKWIGLWIAVLIFGAGCGYQFSGSESGLPPEIKSIFVEPFVNSTPAVGIDSEIASALRSELRLDGRLRVARWPEEADAVLTGVIRGFDNQVVSVNRRDTVLQYEAVLVVDMSLRRREPNELLWRVQGIKLTELYSGSRGAVVTSSSDFARGSLNAVDVRRLTDVQLTETLREEARVQLIDRLARELRQRLMEMF